MGNKTIAIVDINNFHKQNIESLIFACILEKKVNRLTVLDLNNISQDKLLPNKEHWQKEGDILTTRLFSNTSYQICSQMSVEQNKLLNLAKALQAISDILLINVNSQQYNVNTNFYELANEIVVFADLEKDAITNVMNFYLKHSLKNKKILIVIHNYKSNVQNDKTYLQLLKQFKSPNITICNIDNIPEFKTLKEIENVDPWLEIYKKINSTF